MIQFGFKAYRYHHCLYCVSAPGPGLLHVGVECGGAGQLPRPPAGDHRGDLQGNPAADCAQQQDILTFLPAYTTVPLISKIQKYCKSFRCPRSCNVEELGLQLCSLSRLTVWPAVLGKAVTCCGDHHSDSWVYIIQTRQTRQQLSSLGT